MATYSTNLALTLLTTGEGAGTWGNTTNTNLGTLLEQAISGYVTQAVATGTDTTLTIPNGATGVARNMYIELTGTGGTNTNLIVPANKKLYFIFNNSTGAVTVKVSGQTGVSVPTGKKMVLVSNGTDIVNGINYIADLGTNSFTVTNLTATSATITTLTAPTLTGTTLSYTSGTIGQFGATSANITTLTGTTATYTNVGATSANITTLTGTTATYTNVGATSANITTLTGTTATYTNVGATSANITTLTGTTATYTNLAATSANITTLTGTTATYTNVGATSANITTLTGTSATITTILDGSGNVRNIPSAGAEKTSVYTLSISDIGEYVTIGASGGIDVPNGVFSAGNAVSIVNNTGSAATISLTITTAYAAGVDTDRGSVSLATRGVATVLFLSNSVCIISGNIT